MSFQTAPHGKVGGVVICGAVCGTRTAEASERTGSGPRGFLTEGRRPLHQAGPPPQLPGCLLPPALGAQCGRVIFGIHKHTSGGKCLRRCGSAAVPECLCRAPGLKLERDHCQVGPPTPQQGALLGSSHVVTRDGDLRISSSGREGRSEVTVRVSRRKVQGNACSLSSLLKILPQCGSQAAATSSIIWGRVRNAEGPAAP